MQHTRLQMDNSSAAPHTEPRSLQPQYVDSMCPVSWTSQFKQRMFRGSQNFDFVTSQSVAVHIGRALQRRKSKWEGFVDVTVHNGEYQRALTVSNRGLLF